MAINDQRKQIKVDLEYPFAGVSESYAYSDQPPNTSRDERNMRPWDPSTGRMRGTQRAGLGLLTGTTPASGASKIADLASVQREVNILDWSTADTPFQRGSIEFTKDKSAGDSHCVDLRLDTFDTYWALSRGGQVAKLNDDGKLIKLVDTPVDVYAKFWSGRIAVDDYGNFFVASAYDVSHTAADNDDAMIHGYELMADGSYRLAWTLKPGFQIIDIGVYGADLYVWGLYKSNTIADQEWRFERFPQYGFDEVPVKEDNSSWYYAYDTGIAGTDYWDYTAGPVNDWRLTGEMAIRPDGDVYVTAAISDHPDQKHGLLARLKPISTVADEEVWLIEHAVVAAADSGFGACVKYSEKKAFGGADIFWTAGLNGANSGYHVAIWTDVTDQTSAPLVPTERANYSMDSGATASNGFTLSSAPGAEQLRSAIDQNGNFYMPYHGDDALSKHNGYHMLIFGYTEWSITVARREANTALGLVHTPITIAVTRSVPDYNGLAVSYGDVVVLGGTAQTSDPNDSVNVVELVSPTIDNTLAIREVKQIAASGGKWYTYGSGGFTEVLDEDGAAVTYKTATNYVASASGQGVVFYTDGHRYYYYDPAKNAMYRWRSKSQGSIPPRCRLIEFWRNRIVLARSDDAPGAWHMSRYGDAYDWDQFPATPDVAAAVSATTSKAGRCPDSINAIVPMTDDALLFGCDSSIWRVSGDPGSGGVLDLVSDEIGMSWGRPWCKDAEGRVWFFGSKGGLFMMDGSGMRDMSLGRVRKRLQNIDLSVYYVRLAYNYIEDGVHVFVVPFTNSPSGALVDHYFFDKRTDSWHIDKFGRVSTDLIQPTAVIVSDGDAPQDRAVHLGGEDGRVRVWGRNTTGAIPLDDERTASANVPIDSYVLMGPLAPVRDDAAVALSDFKAVLAPNYSGCNYEYFETDNAAQLGDAQQSGNLTAGRNGSQLIRVAGDSIYLRMRNARAGETWSYEKGSVFQTYAGITRPR